MSGALPSQTVGPFFHFGLTVDASLGCMAGPQVRGEHIRLRFTLLDGDDQPVPDGMIELWQADAEGRYATHADGFCGFGRLATDALGQCKFCTIRPGRISDRDAAHINVSVFARGLLARLCTRVYFELTDDPVLMLVPDSRRATLLAHPSAEPGLWDFIIRLQGEQETVFFDV